EPVNSSSNRSGKKSSGDAGGQSDASKLDPESWAKKLAGLKENAAKIAADLSAVDTQLGQIYSVKDALCKRQSELISACIVHTPLSPASWRTASACRSDRRIWDSRQFTVDLRGLSGRFQIVLDNSIESSVFETGKPVTIQWSSRGSRSLKDLKLSDISIIKLKAIEGSLAEIENATFDFKVDKRTLLNQRDFLLSTKTDNAIVVSQIPLTDELATPECRVDEAELESIVEGAVSKVVPPEKKLLPEDKVELPFELRTQTFTDLISGLQREYEMKSDSYLASAQDVSRIRRDLRGDLQLGCWGKEVIRSIEVNINGSHLSLSDWDRSRTQNPIGPMGNPTQTVLDLGGSLRFTNNDENTTAIFREGSRWLLTAATDLTIGDISNIQIQKGGYSYESTKNCWSTWGGLGTACEWQNRESNRTHLSGMTLKINGQPIYQRDSIDFVFERNTLNWIEKDLTANPAYVELMRRRDCSVSSGHL
ncbi:hypothetical protein EBR21_06365, partial [bacterium]|nr:hypothetical protein [bacterium]